MNEMSHTTFEMQIEFYLLRLKMSSAKLPVQAFMC